MTGVELCQALTALRAEGAARSLYVILLTAHGDKGKVVEGLEAGADDFLRKPYNFQELLARIHAGERIQGLQEELIARQIELKKSNAELGLLNEKLTRLANFDALTSLPNRRYTLERFADAWAQARRYGRPLSCIMLDIDHFKQVNDTHGHKAGDVVLQEVAAALHSLVRRYDVCGRFGGEEFLCVCPEATVEAAAMVAERMRVSVSQQEIFTDGVQLSVTISLGVAGMRLDHSSPDALTAEADAMLYAAKEHGRNQVWYADSIGKGRSYEGSTASAQAASQSHAER